MADSPPPYSLEGRDSLDAPHRHAGNFKLPSTQIQVSISSSIEDYKHRQDVYISTSTSNANIFGPNHEGNDTVQSVSALHIWPSGPLSLDNGTTLVPVVREIKLEHLMMVQGFQDCGTLRLTQEAASGDENSLEDVRQMVHDHLKRRTSHEEARRDQAENVDEDATTDATLAPHESTILKQSKPVVEFVSNSDGTDQLQNSLQGDGSSTIVRLYKVHMFSKVARDLKDPAFDERSLLFQWAKPNSAYGSLRGFWEPSLVKVLDDGVFRGGRELMILVRGVSDQQMERLRVGWEEGKSFLDFA